MKIEEVTAIESYMANLRDIFENHTSSMASWNQREARKQLEIAMSKALVKTIGDNP